jgi:DNA-binding response OmpR family regulator
LSENDGQTIQGVGELTMVATAQRHKVLVIDDSFMVRKSLVDQLSGNRFEVYEANDGPTGLDQAVKVDPDVILLDYVMPGMNGYEVYQALRAQPQFTNTPIIIISSSREEVIKKFGQPFVGFDFLPKAFTREQLEERIDAVLPVRQTGIKLPPVNFSEVQNTMLERLDGFEGRIFPGLESVMQRLERLEGLLGTAPSINFDPLETKLSQRIDSLRYSVEQSFLDRLSALEQKLPTDRTQEILNRLPADRTDELLQRIANLTQSFPTPAPDRTEDILSRLGQLQSALPTPVADRTGEVLARMYTLEQTINRLPTQDRTGEVLTKLEQLTRTLEELKSAPPTEVPALSFDPVLSRLNTLEEKITAGSSGNGGGSPAFLPWAILVVGLIGIIATFVKG